MGGHIPDKGGLFGITGGAGTAKTLTLLNIAKREISEGRNVLFCLCDENLKSVEHKMKFFKDFTLKKNTPSKNTKAVLRIGVFSESPGTVDLNRVLEACEEERYDTILIEGLDRVFIGKAKNSLTRMVLTEKIKKILKKGWGESARKNLVQAIRQLSIIIANKNYERIKTDKPFRVIGTIQAHRSLNGYEVSDGAITYASSVLIHLKRNDNHYSATVSKNRWGDSDGKELKFIFET
jgi:hypothetical protein